MFGRPKKTDNVNDETEAELQGAVLFSCISDAASQVTLDNLNLLVCEGGVKRVEILVVR